MRHQTTAVDRPPAVGAYMDAATVACRGPSILNTQPWLWRVRPDGLDLVADRSRQLLRPEIPLKAGRWCFSCGVALHHAPDRARRRRVLSLDAGGPGCRAANDL